MSRPPYTTYPHHHPHHGRPYIVVTDHDILCGRGVNIASHSGNERFRALVNTRHDESYCTAYTTSEKRAAAEDILKHLKSLNPPGRFLKRSGRSQSSRGLNGPWEILCDKEALKKTCQALRDCNRTDRSGYASTVKIPVDVKQNVQQRSRLSNKEHASKAAAVAHSAGPHSVVTQSVGLNPGASHSAATRTGALHSAARMFDQPSLHHLKQNLKRPLSTDTFADNRICTVSPSIENAAEWRKKRRIDQAMTPPNVAGTSASAVVTTSPGIPPVTSLNLLPSDNMLPYPGPTAPSPLTSTAFANMNLPEHFSMHNQSVHPIDSTQTPTHYDPHHHFPNLHSIYAPHNQHDFMPAPSIGDNNMCFSNQHHNPFLGMTPTIEPIEMKLNPSSMDQLEHAATAAATAVENFSGPTGTMYSIGEQHQIMPSIYNISSSSPLPLNSEDTQPHSLHEVL